jgi:phage shock protein A
MFDRLMSLIKGMFNKGMSKMETPEVLAEEAEAELESNFKKITEAITEGITTEKLLEQKVQKNAAELATWEKRALTAVQQNNDDLARQCLAKKQELAQMAQQYDTQLSEQKKTNISLKERHGELKAKIDDFRIKKNQMLARMKAQDQQAKAAELASGAAGVSSLDKWEQKIAEKEARSQAVRELAGTTAFDDQVKQLDKAAALDDELSALKAIAASGGTSGPKLIEAKGADPNVPMIVVAEIVDDKDKK